MPYQVKRPSETRLKNGRRPAPTPTRPRGAKPNPGLGPVMGQFFGLADAKAKPAPAKDAKQPTKK